MQSGKDRENGEGESKRRCKDTIVTITDRHAVWKIYRGTDR